MNLDDLKDKLDDATLNQLKNHVADLTGQRDAAKKESIEGRRNLKAELEQLRSFKARLMDRLGLDDDTDIDTLPDARGQAEAARQFEAKVKRLERELGDKSKALDEMSGRYRKFRQDAEIAKSLGDMEFIHRQAAEALLTSAIEWDGEDILYKTDTGLVPLSEGVKLFAERNPTLLKSAGTAGTGGHNNAASGERTSAPALDTAAIYAARQAQTS